MEIGREPFADNDLYPSLERERIQRIAISSQSASGISGTTAPGRLAAP